MRFFGVKLMRIVGWVCLFGLKKVPLHLNCVGMRIFWICE